METYFKLLRASERDHALLDALCVAAAPEKRGKKRGLDHLLGKGLHPLQYDIFASWLPIKRFPQAPRLDVRAATKASLARAAESRGVVIGALPEWRAKRRRAAEAEFESFLADDLEAHELPEIHRDVALILSGLYAAAAALQHGDVDYWASVSINPVAPYGDLCTMTDRIVREAGSTRKDLVGPARALRRDPVWRALHPLIYPLS